MASHSDVAVHTFTNATPCTQKPWLELPGSALLLYNLLAALACNPSDLRQD